MAFRTSATEWVSIASQGLAWNLRHKSVSISNRLLRNDEQRRSSIRDSHNTAKLSSANCL